MRYKVFAFACLLIGLTVGYAAEAQAHHPEISARTSCANGAGEVTLTVVSWATNNGAHRHNNLVSVSVDGATVGSGVFTPANGYGFTLTVPASVGTHTARATAVAPFGPNGQFGSAGEFRTTTFTVSGECVPPTTSVPSTTVPPTTPPTTDPPVTTTPPVTTVAPPSTSLIPPVSTVQRPPDTGRFAPPTELAQTGINAWWLASVGVAALYLGFVLMRWANRMQAKTVHARSLVERKRRS